MLFFAAGLQMLLALFDLTGVLLLALVAATATSLATNQPLAIQSPNYLVDLLPTDIQDVMLMATIASFLLVSKSILSLWLTRRIFRFIANRQAIIASQIAHRLLNRPLLDLQVRSSQETTAALTTGINAVTIGTMGPFIVIVAEITLVSTMVIGLLFIDITVAFFTVVFFGAVTILLQRLLGNWAQTLGYRQTTAEIGSMESIQNALQTYREVMVVGRRNLFISRFQTLRWEAAKVQADIYVVNQVSKYVFEVSLIVGAGLLILLMSATRDITSVVAILTVFLASSSRIFPSLMRLQSSMATVRNSVGQAEYTYRLVDALDATPVNQKDSTSIDRRPIQFHEAIYTQHPGFSGSLECSEIWFKYPRTNKDALAGITFSIRAGESVALVGSTGAGKSTLADVLLGVLVPDSGQVLVSGHQPFEAVSRWPGAMAYVPQATKVLAGSIRENVALGIPPDQIDDSLVWNALERAHLADFLSQQREGLETDVGEAGVQLSGGQRQRLGIARGLYSCPKLLVLDEATSALDAETEKGITETLASLVGEVTLIVIAHRLATIKNFDRLLYLSSGEILTQGTFEEVRRGVPNFDRQAKILGL